MKPYAFRGLTRENRIFNYRLSRVRRVSENAFGILANRFRVFLTLMQLSSENAEKVVLASSTYTIFCVIIRLYSLITLDSSILKI